VSIYKIKMYSIDRIPFANPRKMIQSTNNFALLFVCFFLSLFVFTSWSNFFLDHRTFNSYNLFRIILLWNKWIRKICGNRVVLLLCFMFIKPGRCVFMYIFRLDCWTVPSSFICRLYHFSWIRERDSVYAIHFYFVDRHINLNSWLCCVGQRLLIWQTCALPIFR
jgi:hypothetical protein